MISSVTLNSLEVGVDPHYAVMRTTITKLKAAPPREPIIAPRPGRAPKFVRSQVVEQSIPFEVVIIGTLAEREDAFNDLVAAASDGDEVPLAYVEDGTTYTIMVSCSGPEPTDEWYRRASIAMVTADPRPVVT